MKKLILIFICNTFIFSAFSQGKIDQSGHLIGSIKKSDFLRKQYKGWFEYNYKNYKPDSNVVDEISKNLKDVSVMCFMGTWCKDSRLETPRFFKIMEAAKFDFNKKFKMIALNRSKKTPDNQQKGYNIIRIPTFIFYNKGDELGRFVEYPRETLEKDILKILTKKTYKHSYQR